MATTIGTIELIAKIDTGQYKKGEEAIDKSNKNIEKSTGEASSRSNKSWSTVAKVGLATVAAAAIAAGAAITKNIGNAIRRVDTLNNANRTFENMGFQTEQVGESMSELVKSITGLPTPLDSAVRGMQSLAATYGDVGQGQRIFTALNNAILGFGGTAAEVDNAIQQLSQLPMDGPLDAQTWNSLRNSGLTPVLVAISKDMGLSINEMKRQFGEGELTVKDFTEALVRMDKEGGGGMKSLEQIARDATSGISTGWANMQTAITRGIANVIEAIGTERIANAINAIGVAFESGAVFAVTAIEKTQQFFGFIKDNEGTLTQLVTVMAILLTPAIIKFGVQSTIAFAQYAAGVATSVALTTVASAKIAAGWLLALGPIGLIVAAVAAAAALIIMNWDAVKNFAVGVWNTITNAVSSAFNWIKANWPLLLAIITGPIGLAAYAIIKNFDKIKSAVGNVWNWIKGVFGTIGSVAATIIKAPVNAIIGFAQNTINGFIRAVNGAIDSINNIPGVNIGRLGEISIPMLAEGGIVTAPTLAMIGEGREDEIVLPLSKLDDILERERGQSTNNTESITINISGIFATSPAEQRRVAEQIAQRLQEVQRAKGLAGGVA